MVDRLTHVGMVSRTQDPDNRRRIKLTLTAAGQQIIGNAEPGAAKRLHAVLTGMSPQSRGHLIDVLRNCVQAQSFAV